MSLQKPEKRFGVYYWDTFDRPGEDTYLLHEFDTLEEAVFWVENQQVEVDEGREQYVHFTLKASGADRVEAVDYLSPKLVNVTDQRRGAIVRTWQVG